MKVDNNLFDWNKYTKEFIKKSFLVILNSRITTRKLKNQKNSIIDYKVKKNLLF